MKGWKEKREKKGARKMDLKEQCSSSEGNADRLAGWQAGMH